MLNWTDRFRSAVVGYPIKGRRNGRRFLSCCRCGWLLGHRLRLAACQFDPSAIATLLHQYFDQNFQYLRLGLGRSCRRDDMSIQSFKSRLVVGYV